jgi:phage major head subunit gpT-like protein
MGASGLGSRAIIGEFYHKLSQILGLSWIDQISMMFKSDQESETYKWLGAVPQMREWVGGRQAKGFRENGITIANKLYESTLEVLVDDMRRDKTGQIMLRVGEQAKRAMAHWNKLLSTLIAAGTSGLCYDGQYFFDTDHSEGDSGTQVNLLTASQVADLNISTITAPTSAEMVKAVLGVIAYMMSYKDDQGEPMNEDARSFVVMVGTPAIWSALAEALGSTTVLSGGAAVTNVLSTLDGFTIRGEFNPRLSALTTQMLTFRTDSDVKPFIRQEEMPITMSAIAEGSELEFKENKHQYGIKALRNVGYGYWQMGSYATFS